MFRELDRFARAELELALANYFRKKTSPKSRPIDKNMRASSDVGDETVFRSDFNMATVSVAVNEDRAKRGSVRVIHRDRPFFEMKRQALAWAEAHPHFMMVQIVPRDSRRERQELALAITKKKESVVAAESTARLPETYDLTTAISPSPNLSLRFARRRA